MRCARCASASARASRSSSNASDRRPLRWLDRVVALAAAAWQRASSAIGEPLAGAVGSRLVRFGVIAD
jgi:hypothetical protein